MSYVDAIWDKNSDVVKVVERSNAGKRIFTEYNAEYSLYYKDPKNVLKQEVTFKDNIINGPSKEYYPNGKLMAEGNKIEVSDGFDVYDGIVQIYDSTGQLSRTVTYEKGRQIDKSAN